MTPSRPPKDHSIAVDVIASRILVLRGQRVLIDTDLAELYGVPTKRLNEQVRRNAERFPTDFMFPLEQDEWDALRSQSATLNAGRGRHRKYLPYAFTEHGALMAATVLNSARAVEVSIYIMRAFVQLRELLAGHRELAKRLDELERRLERKLVSQDQAIVGILDAIRQLTAAGNSTKKRPIGFVTSS
jgi:hypothetical protein